MKPRFTPSFFLRTTARTFRTPVKKTRTAMVLVMLATMTRITMESKKEYEISSGLLRKLITLLLSGQLPVG